MMTASQPNTGMFWSIDGMLPGTYRSERRRRLSAMSMSLLVDEDGGGATGSRQITLEPLGDDLAQHDLARGEDPSVVEVPAQDVARRLRSHDVQVAVDLAPRVGEDVPGQREELERPRHLVHVDPWLRDWELGACLDPAELHVLHRSHGGDDDRVVHPGRSGEVHHALLDALAGCDLDDEPPALRDFLEPETFHSLLLPARSLHRP